MASIQPSGSAILDNSSAVVKFVRRQSLIHVQVGISNQQTPPKLRGEIEGNEDVEVLKERVDRLERQLLKYEGLRRRIRRLEEKTVGGDDIGSDSDGSESSNEGEKSHFLRPSLQRKNVPVMIKAAVLRIDDGGGVESGHILMHEATAFSCAVVVSFPTMFFHFVFQFAADEWIKVWGEEMMIRCIACGLASQLGSCIYNSGIE